MVRLSKFDHLEYLYCNYYFYYYHYHYHYHYHYFYYHHDNAPKAAFAL